MTKTIIIYLPNGTEAKFTTSQAVSGTEYALAETIDCELNSVNIALLEDGKFKRESYSGMPYWLETFSKIDKPATFDIVFNDDYTNTNKQEFALSLEDAKTYIKTYNGTNESYFRSYKGETVAIVCNETGERVYEETVR